MPTVIRCGVLGRPGDHVRSPSPDFLIAARAPVGLGGRRTRDRPHDVVLAAPGVAPLADRRADPARIRQFVADVTAIVTGHIAIFAD
jgi:hypothetical protein